jgi:hypothetical protein
MASMARALVLGLAVALMALGTAPASAQEVRPSLLGQFGAEKSWAAWTVTDATGLVCYISASPKRTEPANVVRSPISFIVVHRKGVGTRNEIQSMMGYPLNEQPNASANIDGTQYPMVSNRAEGVWLARTQDEGPFVEAMKKGTELVVRATSMRGTNTVDYYSLSGVTAAMAEIDRVCA